ncbi:response regulator [Saccharothrix variisporea]|uniref:Response regulator receiver domain-containing protein n=1 Tax=Saccharothrix variisporea TaxID=543527 RepID=A0A495XAL4_9PSEU|nr:response regulator [Saccharothrix variisporea]RKT70135.1 response regulator receiver domain-containing protein [Saccharothrix variisporea]
MAEIITAVAALLWPLIVLTLLVTFRRPLREVVHSAKHREVTLEVGGQLVTLGKLNEVQNSTIADLQRQIGTLKAELEAKDVIEEDRAEHAEVDGVAGWSAPLAVLWVDDHPENNVLQVEQLRRNGVRVDLVTSTAEGVARFEKGRYRAVVTDLARHENGTMVTDAGLRLVRALKALDPAVPIAVYGGWRAVEVADALKAAGAGIVTDSPFVLSEFLRERELL